MATTFLALCLTLIVFMLVAALTSAIVALAWHLLQPRLDRLAARIRERIYLGLRLAPAVAGMAFVALFHVPAFLLFEPPDSGERASAKVIALAAAAALPLFTCARTAWRSWWFTRARVAGWLAEAEPLHLREFSACPAFAVRAPFPVVAVVGVCRPFLVVSRAVIDACSGEELAAILQHEVAHLENRDNLKRLLMFSAPHLFFGAALSRNIERGWQQAAEEVADDRAGAPRALDLAAALIKVARLAQGCPAPPATVAAFCQGGDIDRRVRRLTAGSVRQPVRLRGRTLLAGFAALAAAIFALALQTGALAGLHAATEVVVRYLQ
ncbi:MAG: M48 family metalloprotease [Acidobacteriota bacterium]|jgi:Zn-dependent protease with chaperone function